MALRVEYIAIVPSGGGAGQWGIFFVVEQGDGLSFCEGYSNYNILWVGVK